MIALTACFTSKTSTENADVYYKNPLVTFGP